MATKRSGAIAALCVAALLGGCAGGTTAGGAADDPGWSLATGYGLDGPAVFAEIPVGDARSRGRWAFQLSGPNGDEPDAPSSGSKLGEVDSVGDEDFRVSYRRYFGSGFFCEFGVGHETVISEYYYDPPGPPPIRSSRETSDGLYPLAGFGWRLRPAGGGRRFFLDLSMGVSGAPQPEHEEGHAGVSFGWSLGGAWRGRREEAFRRKEEALKAALEKTEARRRELAGAREEVEKRAAEEERRRVEKAEARRRALAVEEEAARKAVEEAERMAAEEAASRRRIAEAAERRAAEEAKRRAEEEAERRAEEEERRRIEEARRKREAVPALIEALRHTDFRERMRAAAALMQIGPEAGEAVPAVVAALIKTLGDARFEVRTSAAEALAKIGPSAVPALVKALEEGESKVRRIAAYALGEMGPAAKDAVPALERALEGADRRVRRSAAEALVKVREGEARRRARAIEEEAERRGAEEERRRAEETRRKLGLELTGGPALEAPRRDDRRRPGAGRPAGPWTVRISKADVGSDLMLRGIWLSAFDPDTLLVQQGEGLAVNASYGIRVRSTTLELEVGLSRSEANYFDGMSDYSHTLVGARWTFGTGEQMRTSISAGSSRFEFEGTTTFIPNILADGRGSYLGLGCTYMLSRRQSVHAELRWSRSVGDWKYLDMMTEGAMEEESLHLDLGMAVHF